MKRKRLVIAALAVIVLASGLLWWSRRAAAPGHKTVTKTATKSPAAQPAPIAPVVFNKAAHATTDPASIWAIVNKQHPLNPKAYAPADLVSVGNGQLMRAEAGQALKQLLADAKTNGYSITADSGYRSYGTQVTVYNNEVANYGVAVADSESARPGYSEHQTGLAVDIGSGGCNITDCFANTPGGKWAAVNAYKYGFLLRYTPEKVAITGYRSEAWHFRYIGPDLASEMHKQGISTLEEYFGVSGGTSY